MQLPIPGIIVWGFEAGDAGDIVAEGTVCGVDGDVVLDHGCGGEVPAGSVLWQRIVFHINHGRGAIGVSKSDVVMGLMVVVVVVLILVIFH